MTYRLARSLAVFRDEVNARWPNRDKASDGWIGDAAHASRQSDHNPWVKDSAGVGVVRAYDTDAGTGANTDIGLWLAEHVRALGQSGHPALGTGSYVISARRIASPTSEWKWRAYTGANPHTTHTHVSVSLDQAGYDSTHGWGIADGGPTPPPVPGARPTIRYGSRGDAVREAQQRLAAHGFSPGTVDAVFGPKTLEATKRFQATRALSADGIIGPKTWGALLAAPPAPPPPAPAPMPARPTIRRGSKGDAVRELQAILNAWYPSMPRLAVDGDFGSATEARVKHMQRSAGLTIDGIVGPNTWRRLLGG